uniref:AIG1-type G domain-containing protein n=1 Tax=Chenopodium quinoa TaxID=63459 RepID=A0A803MPA5_CHEQI
MESEPQVDRTSLLSRQPSDNQTLEKLIEVDETDAPASGSALGSPGVRAPKAEELGDEGTQEKSELESLETKDVGDDMGSKVEENASESRDGEPVNEGDAVVDSIKVDVVEAVRSGVAVVGVEDDNKQDSKVESVDIVAGDTEKEVDAEVEVGEEETSVAEEPALVDSASVEDSGVKLTEEGDSVVDSINVDAGEAVRSGAAIVGEVKEEKESEDSGTDENAVVEEFLSTVEGKDSGNSGTVGENTVEESSSIIEDTAAELPDEVDFKSVETGEAKVTDEGDAVVDAVNVDVVEAVRSGVAVVGDADVGTETDIKERSDLDTAETKVDNSAVEKPASTEEDSVGEEPAKTDSKSMKTDEAKVTDEGDLVVDEDNVGTEPVKSGVAVMEDSGAAGTEMKAEVKEVEAPAGENTTLANDNHVNSSEIVDNSDKETLANEEETPASEEINAEAAEFKQHESADGMLSVSEEAEERFYIPQEEYDEGSDGEGEPLFFKSEISSRNFMEELVSGDRSEMIDGQVVTDSEEEADSDEEGEGRELIDSAALAALLKAATSSGSDTGPITITSQDGSRLFSVERPAGLGTSLRSVRPASNSSNSSIFATPSAAAPSEESLSDEDKKKLQKIQDLRVKFLRLVQRIGQTVDQSVSSQVLYKLAILAGRTTVPSFSLDNAKQTAMQLEAEGKDDLDFSLTLLVLGKSGVGKSATINSIFGEEKVKINAFEPETTSVNEVSGVVDGVKIRVIDAPGLKSSALEQAFNRKVLASVKKFTKRYPPDLTLYVDRLDSQTRDLNDLPMLRTISNSLGSSIWRSTILTLTHAACAPPDGPTGTSIGYEVFVGQRSHVIQQSIGQAVGDLRFMNLGMMNPVSLVENHPACRKNREGLKVLPNGQAWRPQLMLLCYSLKILADASLTSKPQDPVDHRKFFNFRTRSPPLPYLLSSLLQPRTHPKLSADQGGDNGDSDVDLDDLSDSDQEEDEYDQLPPFKPLRKTQIAKLSREQKKAYFEEYDYRVKLLQRKQLREELKRMRDMKKNGKPSVDEYSEMPEDYDGENGAPAAVPVPLPDMVLPPSFDSDTPAYRYRFLEPTSQFLARPVLDTHGWDHDCGYDGVNVEQNLGIAGRFPAAVTVQVTKDKKDFNIHLDSAVSAKHGENGSSLVGFDIQTIGKQLAYIVRGESKFKNLKKNKTAAGVSVTFLGENVATGVKLEDQIALGKRLVLVGSTGTVRSQKDAAYGANLEIRLREEDYPIGQDQSSFVLSLMKWRGDLAIGGNLQSQISVGRGSKMAVRVALNNKQSGQITVRTSSSDHVALAYAGLIPIALAIYRKFRPSVSENYSIY